MCWVIKLYVKIPKNKISKMEIVKTDCTMTLSQVVSKYKCHYAINGGLYDMKTGVVSKIPLRINGKTIATSSDTYWMMAWNVGPDICMINSTEMGKWRYAVACSTMLKGGVNTIFKYTSEQGGIRGRTGFGDDDLDVHLCVTTDTNGPISPTGLRSTMKANGCKNGLMMDSGGSSQLYALGKYYQAEKRKVSYWICIWLKASTSDSEDTQSDSCPYKEPSVTVKSGTRGESAKWVQWHLQRIGYDIGKIDGIFGAKSVSALIDFQSKHGLTADGACGKITRAALKSV